MNEYNITLTREGSSGERVSSMLKVLDKDLVDKSLKDVLYKCIDLMFEGFNKK